jgi:hypothetical protein
MCYLGLGHGGNLGWRWVMIGGSHMSVRERERRGVPVQDSFLGREPLLLLG